ncbi:Coenzyme F420 hydrogenase/dehydrogenase, beta subunit C-terminal domain [Phocaeicola vulgatus]|nr:Coenzyme F420 hydrogenase/dehydrogenase, beta subunit C-terminal domain [Phocaeicola vulgatus]
MPTIVGIEFRDKTLHGWKKYSFVVRGKSAFNADKNSVLLSDIHRENPFMRGFLSDIYLRPSCYECKCKNGVSHSDLTIADFWGIDRLMPDFDDDKGIGLALVNTVKGKQIFKRLSIDIRLSALSDVVALNGGFKEYRRPHPARLVFFRRFAVGETVESIVEDILRVPLWRRVMRNIKTFCKMIINRKQLTIIPLFIRRSKKRDK